MVVLGLTGIAGVLAAATLGEALFGTTLAAVRAHQQRAWAQSDRGAGEAMDSLAAEVLPEDYRIERRVAGEPDSAIVALRRTGTGALPAGFSAGRFAIHRFEITSTGRSARGAQAVQVLGVSRVLPAPVAAESP